MRACVMCGAMLTGRRAKYCSQLCQGRGFNAARKADGRQSEYNRRVVREGNIYQRKRLAGLTGLPIVDCAACGCPTGKIAVPGRERRVCSTTCRAYLRNGKWPSCAVPQLKQPYVQPDRRSPLRIAWEDQDWEAVREHLLARTERHPSGCRIWTGSQDKDRYSIVRIGKQRIAAYRVMATATNGGHLGSNPVHHVCANRMCIAPDHLQVVLPHENAAEMLHRKWYVQRIADLEAALANADPSHPLLTQLPLAG